MQKAGEEFSDPDRGCSGRLAVTSNSKGKSNRRFSTAFGAKNAHQTSLRMTDHYDANFRLDTLRLCGGRGLRLHHFLARRGKNGMQDRALHARMNSTTPASPMSWISRLMIL